MVEKFNANTTLAGSIYEMNHTFFQYVAIVQNNNLIMNNHDFFDQADAEVDRLKDEKALEDELRIIEHEKATARFIEDQIKKLA